MDTVEECSDWKQGHISSEDVQCFVTCECGEIISVSDFQVACKCGLVYFTNFQVFRLRKQ